MYNLSIVIDRICTVCAKKGISVNQMLIASNAGKSLIDNMKKGRNPSIDRLYLVAEFLNTSSDFLLGLTDEPNKKVSDSISNDTFSGESAIALLANIERNAKTMNSKGLQRLSDYSDDLRGNPAYQKTAANEPKPSLAIRAARSVDDKPIEIVERDESKFLNAPEIKL